MIQHKRPICYPDFKTTVTSSASLPRIKRQMLPDLSAFPMTPGADGGQLIPQASSNPFLDTMYTPYNLDWGLGVSVLNRPFLMGGNVNFPTGNKMKPTDSVAGTFSYATPWNLRYGTQGGPFFPWQNKEFYKTAESISQVNALNNGAPLPMPESLLVQNQAAPGRSCVALASDVDDPKDKFVEDMFKPRNVDFGIGIGVLRSPFMMGGDMTYPTGNRMHPVDSVGGSFAYAQPFDLKYETQ
uniref:Uncharacterized protein n=1 Tax=Romanomermis culicivorax TaxID=13658 RepID=A0A915IJW6_ROMCU